MLLMVRLVSAKFYILNCSNLSSQTLTMEEYSFLEEYGVNDEDGFSESMAWSTGEESGGMGDEAEAAYEEFLRLQS